MIASSSARHSSLERTNEVLSPARQLVYRDELSWTSDLTGRRGVQLVTPRGRPDPRICRRTVGAV